MRPRVYISYRPEDSSRNEVAVIHQRLSDEFGADNVLQSTGSNIETRASLQSIITSCDLVLVVIGQYWFDLVDDDGMRLIDDEFDPIRIEIETSFQLKKPVTVVLVDDIVLPDESNIAVSLRPLTHHRQIRLDPHCDFDAILDNLVHIIKRDFVRYRIVSNTTQPTKNFFGRSWRLLRDDLKTAGVILLALLGMIVIAFLTTDHVVARLSP